MNMITTVAGLSCTLKRLGDATSRNLAFSYLPNVPVSYGEETITESNLLELKRRHSDLVYLHTFSKHAESKVGADWEWHIVGRRRTLSMRVQAKRVTCEEVLRIRHTVRRSSQQRDLLLRSAQEDRVRPMYCIYCTESQRRIFKQQGALQTGCLLADARDVPLNTRSLRHVEWACWPWHYLIMDIRPIHAVDKFFPREMAELTAQDGSPQPLIWNAPSILDLNQDTERKYDLTGVHDTTLLDEERVRRDGAEDVPGDIGYDREDRVYRRVRGKVAIDVRPLESEHSAPS